MLAQSYCFFLKQKLRCGASKRRKIVITVYSDASISFIFLPKQFLPPWLHDICSLHCDNITNCVLQIRWEQIFLFTVNLIIEIYICTHVLYKSSLCILQIFLILMCYICSPLQMKLKGSDLKLSLKNLKSIW
jgi:hypothetical protein